MGEEPQTPLTPETLQAELQAYQKAINEEFQEGLKSKPNEAAELTKEFFKENMPLAGATIVWLCQYAESETVRGTMAKFIVEQGKDDAVKDGDPMSKLLDKLTKNDRKEVESA